MSIQNRKDLFSLRRHQPLTQKIDILLALLEPCKAGWPSNKTIILHRVIFYIRS